MNMNDIIDLIKGGETEKVEFKSKVTSNIGEDICALANALGGCILIGIDDKGTILGCDTEHSKQKVSDQANSIVPPLRITFQTSKLNDKEILSVQIPQSKHLCSIGGVAYIRIGTSKRPLSMQEVFTLGSENLLFELDRTVTEQRELDTSLMEEFQSHSRTKIPDMEKYMKRAGAMSNDGALTLAGLLFFHPDPEPLVPHASIRLIDKDGAWKRYSGSYLRTIPQLERDLLSRFSYYPIQTGFKRQDVLEYPIIAIREGIVNAVTHRNYAIKSEVFIELSEKYLSIKNPGSFPPGTTPEDPVPIPRNPVIYELMFQFGLVERQGRGIDLIKEECKRHPFVEYSYEIKPNYTVLTFTKTRTSLTEGQKEIINLLSSGEMPSSEIARRTGVSKATVIKRVNELMDINMVEKRGSGTMIRYRLISS